MISIAGQVLSNPPQAFRDLIERDLPQDNAWAFTQRAWPGFGLAGVTWPTGFTPLPRPKVHSFYWPRGASRWAMGLFLVHSLDLKGDDNGPGIHDAAFGPKGDQVNQVTLKMFTEDHTGQIDETLQASVYCLPPIPVKRLYDENNDPDNASYLLTVVDQRYFWWLIPTPDFGINETAGVTWESVFESIGNALDVSIGTDDINEAYLQPSRAINLTWETVPPVLDAAAANVGQRVVCSYDGSVFTQNFETAKEQRKQDADNNKNRVYLAGGERFQEEF